MLTFHIPESAFAPFYDTPVAFHGERAVARPVDLTVECCVFEGGFADPLLEQNSDTDVRVLGLSFPISKWRDETPPQVGDRVTFEDAPFHVTKVERVLSDFHVTIKEGAES